MNFIEKRRKAIAALRDMLDMPEADGHSQADVIAEAARRMGHLIAAADVTDAAVKRVREAETLDAHVGGLRKALACVVSEKPEVWELADRLVALGVLGESEWRFAGSGEGASLELNYAAVVRLVGIVEAGAS